jgi:hypothetical protein
MQVELFKYLAYFALREGLLALRGIPLDDLFFCVTGIFFPLTFEEVFD